MAEETRFAIGAKASCSDGACGEVRRLVVHPVTERITHLVIQPGHRREAARLVPSDLADTTSGEIRLRCTLAEFDQLEHAEERHLTEGVDGVGVGGLLGDTLTYDVSGEAFVPSPGARGRIDLGHPPGHHRTFIQDVVPLGETQVRPGDRVHAVDGEIGRVRGFLADPADDQVTHVLLQEGHLWGHKEIAIPVSAVTGIDAGVRLNITKQQVENLPPVDTDLPS
jgi:hypothetical protein